MELYRTYRPQDFPDVVGNEIAIKTIEKELQNGSHVFLMAGPAGCGKTTLARIIARKVGAGELSIKEINSADNRGIDTAREIMEQMRMNPIDGDAMVWILDECFHKDTLVDTLRGRVRISDIAPGELVFNSDGVARVKSLQKKKVSVDRLLILHTQYGQVLTTCEHLFYTSRGFVKACNLVKGDLLYDIKDMPNMWKGISDISINRFKDLRGALCIVAEKTERFIGETEAALRRDEGKESKRIDLPSVWEEFYDPGKRPSEVLFNALRSYWSEVYKNSIRGTDLCGVWKEIQMQALRQQKDLFSKLSEYLDFFKFNGSSLFGEATSEHEVEQSIEGCLCLEEDERYEGKERNAARLAWRTWRERTPYERADHALQTARGGLVFGTSDKDTSKITISNELQSGYRESIFEDCDRSGRKESFEFQSEDLGREENGFAGTVGVEGIEVYEPGNNGEHFRYYFEDSELDSGFVYLYDLEIDGAPTYYVNGVLVHNCHQYTVQAQNAMLKALEEVPETVYFILCTTDPQKLIEPLKSRCSVITVKSLTNEEMKYLLKRTARAENVKMSSEVYDRICELAQGGGRKGMKLLAKVLYLENDEERLDALEGSAEGEGSQTIELCRALLQNGFTWNKGAQLLKNIDMAEPERVRQAVMGYMNSVLLGGKSNPRAEAAMQAFGEADTYRNGKFAITIAVLDFLSLV